MSRIMPGPDTENVCKSKVLQPSLQDNQLGLLKFNVIQTLNIEPFFIVILTKVNCLLPQLNKK